MSFKSEEFERWRPKMNNGEENSPILSQHQEGVLTSSESKTTLKGGSNFYITLAKESPQRIFENSDESTYDSFHSKETELCRDTSDTESRSSFTTDELGTMEVLEYELASVGSNEALYSNDSSSGTDEDFLLAAVAAKAIYQSTSCYSDFADTEDSNSDNTYDPELSLADYWVCVKCKNKQNNPMYRYCEKCYQIRKSHFPPRPRKGFSKRKRNMPLQERRTPQSPIQSESDRQLSKHHNNDSAADVRLEGGGDGDGEQDSSNLERISNIQMNSKFQNSNGHKNKKHKFSYSHKKSSSDETSSNDCCESNSEMEIEVTKFRGGRKRKISIKSKGIISCSTKKRKSTELSEGEVKKTTINDESVNNNSELKVFSSAISIVKENNGTLLPCILSQKDSGISSAPSSQEIPSSSSHSDDPQVCSKNRYLDDDDDDDSDTVCEELDDKKIEELQKDYSHLRNESPSIEYSNRHTSQLASISNLDLSTTNRISLPVRRSTSDITEVSLGNSPTKKHQISSPLLENLKKETDNELVGGGQCVVCLSEPKNGAFIHTKFAHLCCCYKCAVKIWNTQKKCPICNCPVKNVLKLFVH